jgi:thiamine biosynthesis lipoprotein
METVLRELGYDSNYTLSPKATISDFESNIEFGKISNEYDENKILQKSGLCYMVRISSPIELGGLIKGYILDKASIIFRDIENICVDAGGDLWVKGLNSKGLPWKILLENPDNNEFAIGEVSSSGVIPPTSKEKLAGKIGSIGLFLASSSPSKRKWGKHHHLINPFDRNSAHNMKAVFTQGNSGILVDAFATALFVMGYKKAKEFLNENRNQNKIKNNYNKNFIEALLISDKNEIYKTPDFQGILWNDLS